MRTLTRCTAALFVSFFCVAALAAPTEIPGKSKFVYVSYIKASPEAVWKALTTTETIKQFWGGLTFESEWKTGAPWSLKLPNGTVADAGEIIELSPPKRLVLRWRNAIDPALNQEGFSRCTYTIEQLNGAVKLTVTHEMDVANSKLIEAVGPGWGYVVSNLKSLLETGSVALKDPDRK